MEVLGLNKKKIISKKKISGLSILEAIVSTAIIGIGFVAILQMTNYSVQSIQVSSERTKANYLTNMIAEDVLVNLRLSDDQGKNFSEILVEMTKYIIDEKGSEVISEIHDKDFKAKKAEAEEKANDDEKEDSDADKFTDVSFEDI